MFMTNANCFALHTTSATRSVPLWCLGEVNAISAPQSKAASAMRMSSVAMINASRFFACRHRCQTRCRRGLPAIRCSGFPGKRVELHRAGILARNVGAKIRRLDQTIELSQRLRFDSAIFLDGHQSAADPALIGNDDEFESLRLQTQ